MGLVSLFFYSICLGYLLVCVYAFYYGWSRSVDNKGNNTTSNEADFFYAAMWQDID